ncbi:MAG: YifB family Mg chelatase-like AAA ATPase [Bacillota bacterium]
MLSIVKSIVLVGLQGQIIQVEVDVSNGLPAFDIVGLPDSAVKEARDRVRTALKNAGFAFPPRRVTVNLAPADIRKEGPVYDLAIAAGLLVATEQAPGDRVANLVFLGELSLDGSVKPVKGVLPAVLGAVRHDLTDVMVPSANAPEASLVERATVYPIAHLSQMARYLRSELDIPPHRIDLSAFINNSINGFADMSEVLGQASAKRALEVAAAGGHNILMTGSPGSGKTMLAQRLPGILPDLTLSEALEVTQIHSLAGLLPHQKPLVTKRPFRATHHTVSTVGLIGGGRYPRPGEISLAHHGVLFLDEMPEFPRAALEALRQPLEDGLISISRVNATATYPARIMLVGSMNPCPCGFWGDASNNCNCTPPQIKRYLSRISGPLMDRLDIHIEVPRVPFEQLQCSGQEEPSADIKARVELARNVQRDRLAGDQEHWPQARVYCNAYLASKQIKKYCLLTPRANSLLKSAYNRLNLTARGHNRILKVARTIADLAQSELIRTHHLAEAIQYRNRVIDRQFL